MGNKCYLIIYSISLIFANINKTQKNMNTIYSFEQWDLDLLVDYVQKVHHRGIREKGPKVLNKLIIRMFTAENGLTNRFDLPKVTRSLN